MADRRTSASQSGSRSRTTKDTKTKSGTLLAPLDRPSTSRPSTSKSTTVTRLPTSAPSSSCTKEPTKMPPLDTGKTRLPISRPNPESSRTAERLQTRYTSAHDIEMASRQSKIETLSRSDREQQEKWALSKLSSNTGACLDGFRWSRKTICRNNIPGGLQGYICQGGAHFVTDSLLASGNGKCYLLYFEAHDASHTSGYETWFGPYDANQIYWIFGGSKRDYEARFQRGRGRVDMNVFRNTRVTSSVYNSGEWPHHLTADAKFFN